MLALLATLSISHAGETYILVTNPEAALKERKWWEKLVVAATGTAQRVVLKEAVAPTQQALAAENIDSLVSVDTWTNPEPADCTTRVGDSPVQSVTLPPGQYTALHIITEDSLKARFAAWSGITRDKFFTEFDSHGLVILFCPQD